MSADTNGDDGSPPDDGIATRSRSRNRLVEWVLVDGNRLYVTLGFSVAVFVALRLVHRLGVVGFADAGPVSRLAGGMVAGSFSLVTLVVSVNQLILSQEFSLAGEFRDRFDAVMSFRRDVEDATDVPAAPATPTRLLGLLSAHVRDRADALADSAVESGDDTGSERTVRYARGVIEATREVDDILDGADATAFDALVAAVEYDNEWQHYAARHLRNDASGSSAETRRAFDELLGALRLFSTAQAHFKTVYLQRELTRFSQLTILCGVPSIGAAVLVVLLYGDASGPTVSLAVYPYAVSLLVTVAFVPVGLLVAYVLRTATLTRRTAATGPTLFRKEPDEGPFDDAYGQRE
ncbi:hypothetical protein BRC97_00705 [Halobacteriales archaeon QS_6_71_20]|nr:MAG: hypothetical protein BRC97_00705 [Halobacteriales archaeon QS_6_71_20]